MIRQRYSALAVAAVVVLVALGRGAAAEEEMSAAERKQCLATLHIDPRGDVPRQTAVSPPRNCRFGTRNGFPVPDPACTPGAVNPTLTREVLDDPRFKTECVRNDATSDEQKSGMYAAYGMTEPSRNSGEEQICELDHFISLELGGADTLDNIWPQCGPDDVALRQRFFKQKDIVEDFLGREVRAGRMSMTDAQKGISEDWTQFIDKAKSACPDDKCKKK